MRVAGNFLSDDRLDSIGFCVDFLQVPLLMVLGHTCCGTVTAAIDVVAQRQDLPGRLFVLIDALELSLLGAKIDEVADLLLAATKVNARGQVRRLETISPAISAAREAGQARITGGIL